MRVQLIQFRFSPYNEKVRWALDLKRVPHVRLSVLPGPHAARVRALTGQTATPILALDGRWISRSARILDALDEAFPAQALWPTECDREWGRAVEARFDDDWAPRIRRAVLGAMMTDLDYLCLCFSGHKPAAVRRLYRWAAPFAKRMIASGNGISGVATINDGVQAAREALDFVADARAGRSYLSGDVFSRADLVAASHLAVLCDPPRSSMHRPSPVPAALSDLCCALSDHESARWTLSMYDRHRGPATDFEGRSPY